MPPDRNGLSELVAARGLALLQQLEAELKGNRSAAGRKAGLKQAHASQILDGTKKVGLGTASKIAQHMKLDAGFFTNPALGNAPDYRRHKARLAGSVTRDDRGEESDALADALTLAVLRDALDVDTIPTAFITRLHDIAIARVRAGASNEAALADLRAVLKGLFVELRDSAKKVETGPRMKTGR